MHSGPNGKPSLHITIAYGLSGFAVLYGLDWLLTEAVTDFHLLNHVRTFTVGFYLIGSTLIVFLLGERAHRAKHAALESARLVEQERMAKEAADERATRFHRLTEATAAIGTSTTLASMLQSITDEALAAIRANLAGILLVSPEDGSLTMTAYAATEKHAAFRSYRAPVKGTDLHRWLLEQHGTVRLTQAELAAHPSFAHFGPEQEKHSPIRGLLAVPLQSQGKVTGLLKVSDKQEGDFTADDELILRQLGRMASMAIARSRLHADAVQARDNFQAELERTTAIADSLAEGIIALDAEGRVTFLNRSVEELLGWKADELLGRPLCETLGGAGEDSMLCEVCPARKVLETGNPHWEPLGEVPRKDGSSLPASYLVRPIRHGETVQGVVIAMQDRTVQQDAEQSRRRAEAALREQQELYRLVAEHATDVIILTDMQLVPLYVSPSVTRMTGYTPEEISQFGPGAILTLVHPQDKRKVRDGLKRATGTPQAARVSYRLRRKDGTFIWQEAEGTTIFDQAGKPVRIRFAVRDITDRKRFEEQLERNAFQDSLTGLPNRALFVTRLEHVLTRARRRKEQIAVLFLDLDGFKVVNDSLGHAAGDRLLIEVGRRLQQTVRPDDTLARMSGDEFTILLEPVKTPEEAVQVARTIGGALAKPFRLDEREVFVSASIGIVVAAPGEYRKADVLLRNADVAMYSAKARRNPGYALYDPSMNLAAVDRLELETDLRRAVERNELVVYYQPVVNLLNGEITGVEALVRWNHPRRGLIPPGEFIPLAEETGLIVQVGRWVTQESIRQLKEWQTRFMLPDRFFVSVNVSARHIHEQGVVERIREYLDRYGVNPQSLQLEITESAMMQDPVRAREILSGLKGLGVWLAVDDFGTGYSSLSYLQRFPIDVLKIDRTFVSGMSLADEAILQAIVGVGKALRMDLVAEGIETSEQWQRLNSLGCMYGQGFYFARPLPAGEVSKLLETRANSGDATLTAEADVVADA